MKRPKWLMASMAGTGLALLGLGCWGLFALIFWAFGWPGIIVLVLGFVILVTWDMRGSK